MARYRSTETNTTNSTEAVIDMFPNGQSTYGNNNLNHLGSESITKTDAMCYTIVNHITYLF